MKVPFNELNTTLRILRDVNNLSQAELASRSNLRQASISYVEHNQGGSNVGTINQIAEALGYDLYFLFEKKKPQTPKTNQNESFQDTAD